MFADADIGKAAEDIAVASCFTGQRATDELRQVLKFLDTQPLPEMTSIEYLGPAAFHHEFRGHYTAPNFQAGSKPYETDGDLRFKLQRDRATVAGEAVDEVGRPVQRVDDPAAVRVGRSAALLSQNGQARRLQDVANGLFARHVDLGDQVDASFVVDLGRAALLDRHGRR